MVDASRIECTSSPHAVPDTRAVQVTASGQQFAESSASFTYHAPVNVNSILPTIVKSEGGSTLTLLLRNALSQGTFSPGSCFCRLDVITTPASLRGDDVLQCITPSLSPGFVTVELTLNAEDYTASGIQIQVLQVSIHALQPASGPRLGGTKVMLHGVNLLAAIECVLGGRKATSSEPHGRGRMLCVTDSFTAAGWVVLQLAEGKHVQKLPVHTRTKMRVCTCVSACTAMLAEPMVNVMPNRKPDSQHLNDVLRR